MAPRRRIHAASSPVPLPDPLPEPAAGVLPPDIPAADEAASGRPVRIVALVMAALLTLAGLAWGGFTALESSLQQHRLEARMGPKPRLARFPVLELPLGGARALEMEVSLVLAPKAQAEQVLNYRDRIAERLFQTVSTEGPERLTSPGSAEFLKQSLKDAIRREAGGGLVQDVYIQRMVVK